MQSCLKFIFLDLYPKKYKVINKKEEGYDVKYILDSMISYHHAHNHIIIIFLTL
jgi:hypothetical protein